MTVEVIEKSAIAEQEEKKAVQEVEEGEIVDEGDTKEKPSKAIAATHPLEHSCTFWFDNPSTKSKQAA